MFWKNDLSLLSLICELRGYLSTVFSYTVCIELYQRGLTKEMFIAMTDVFSFRLDDGP